MGIPKGSFKLPPRPNPNEEPSRELRLPSLKERYAEDFKTGQIEAIPSHVLREIRNVFVDQLASHPEHQKSIDLIDEVLSTRTETVRIILAATETAELPPVPPSENPEANM